MDLLPGSQLGPYTIIAPIGEGAMGKVYRAAHPVLGREVAIKALQESLAADPEYVSRFLHEARILARLNHANIAIIYGIEQIEGQTFLILEYVPGETLAEQLARGPVALDEALPIFIQIARALEAAHEIGIIHRDLKPANIKITPDGKVKVLDFGLAKISAKDLIAERMTDLRTLSLRRTGEGVILGTVPYMSPEQTRGRELDRRTDIWAFGCICYEALTGHLPFDGEMVGDVFNAIRSRPPDWRALPSTTPPQLVALLKRCLQKDPQKRLRDIGDARNELEELIDGQRPVPRRWGKWAAAAASLTLIIILAIIWPDIRCRFVDCPPPQDPQLTQLRYDQALSALQREDNSAQVNEAIRRAEELVAADPKRAAFHALLANAYLARFRLERNQESLRLAEEASRRAIALSPDDPDALIAQGNTLVAAKRDQEVARTSFQRALNGRPNNPEARAGLGDVLFNELKYDQARAEYRQALQLKKSWLYYHKIAATYYFQGSFEEAAEHWRQVVALTPDNTRGHTNLANCYFKLGRYEEAEAAYDRSIALNPTFPAYTSLGTVRYFRGRYKDAVDAFEKATKLSPEDPAAWGNLGDGYRSTPGYSDRANRAYDEAIKRMRERLRGQVTTPENHALLAEWLAKRGAGREATEQLAQSFQLQPNCRDCLAKAVRVYEIVGDRPQALDALGRALKLGQPVVEFLSDPELKILLETAEGQRIIQQYQSPSAGVQP